MTAEGSGAAGGVSAPVRKPGEKWTGGMVESLVADRASGMTYASLTEKYGVSRAKLAEKILQHNDRIHGDGRR